MFECLIGLAAGLLLYVISEHLALKKWIKEFDSEKDY